MQQYTTNIVVGELGSYYKESFQYIGTWDAEGNIDKFTQQQ